MRTKPLALFFGACAALALVPHDASAACDLYHHAIADGRLVSIWVPAAADVGFFFNGVPGHSYSVEIGTPDGNNGGDFAASTATNTFPCPTADGAGFHDTTSYDPLVNYGRRGSFIYTGAAGSSSVTHVVNLGSGAYLFYSVSDTTMYSPAWSTNGSYKTYYSIFNTTNGPVSVTLTLTTTAGTAAGSTTIDVAPGVTAATNTVALGTPLNQTGTAKLTHDGPPGALLVESDIANFSVTPAYIQPVKFTTARESAH